MTSIHGAFDDTSRTQEPGVKFQVKCTLLRPPPDGVSYGARVYVDRGEPDTVYTSAAVEGDAEDGVDTAVPDHYFWFGPGETEYCAGTTDADEALYQTFAGLTDKERFADLESHAQALGEYLVNRPDLYEVTATKSKGWLSKGTEYSVSFAELVIE